MKHFEESFRKYIPNPSEFYVFYFQEMSMQYDGRRMDFFPKEPIPDFSGVAKMFFQGGQKWWNLISPIRN